MSPRPVIERSSESFWACVLPNAARRAALRESYLLLWNHNTSIL